jgi:hypothetical protein
MERNFGISSEQFSDAIGELNRFDDNVLKERANKFRDFIFKNNEKPTKAFCLLGKENNLVDDLEQIRDENGIDFVSDKARNDFIKQFTTDGTSNRDKLPFEFGYYTIYKIFNEEFNRIFNLPEYNKSIDGKPLTNEIKQRIKRSVDKNEINYYLKKLDDFIVWY